MKKILYLTLTFISIIFILFNSIEIMNSIKLSFYICINNLFPSLIPFMILSNILINYNFINDLSNILGKFMNKIFKVSKNCSFIFIMSMISGTPSNGKYINELFNNKYIDLNDSTKCLNFCHFTNPIFILGTIGYTFLNDKKLGLIILVSHFLGSIMIGTFNNKKFNNINYNNIKKNNTNLFDVLINSIKSTISTLLLILGIITVCLIVTCILNRILNLNNNFKFLYGLIEVTQGLKYLSLSNFNIIVKSILSSFLISFGGICIHIQIFSIIDNKKIRYLPYLICRIIHAIISSILTYLLITLFY